MTVTASDGRVFVAALTLFPVGYRVSLVWTGADGVGDPDSLGVPQAVSSRARSLTHALTPY